MLRRLSVAWELGWYKAMLLKDSRRAATDAFYRACGLSADEKTAYIAKPWSLHRWAGFKRATEARIVLTAQVDWTGSPSWVDDASEGRGV